MTGCQKMPKLIQSKETNTQHVIPLMLEKKINRNTHDIYQARSVQASNKPTEYSISIRLVL